MVQHLNGPKILSTGNEKYLNAVFLNIKINPKQVREKQALVCHALCTQTYKVKSKSKIPTL